ncbi:MAG TPA: methylated-DNA--[protein]-cysteine S-methyltransferase [Caulobacteraceae bacterium]
MRLQLDQIPSPLGAIRLVTDADGALRALDFEDHEARNLALLRRHYGVAELTPGKAPPTVISALAAYFDGDLAALGRIEVVTAGTPFQEAAWAALRAIPAGATRSYAQQAAAIGRPKAVRAVGLANGANPVGIVNPCHRVIGADGALTGYGGGLERKRWLLAHEGAL